MAKRNGDEEFGNGFAKVLNSGIHNKKPRAGAAPKITEAGVAKDICGSCTSSWK